MSIRKGFGSLSADSELLITNCDSPVFYFSSLQDIKFKSSDIAFSSICPRLYLSLSVSSSSSHPKLICSQLFELIISMLFFCSGSGSGWGRAKKLTSILAYVTDSLQINGYIITRELSPATTPTRPRMNQVQSTLQSPRPIFGMMRSELEDTYGTPDTLTFPFYLKSI